MASTSSAIYEPRVTRHPSVSPPQYVQTRISRFHRFVYDHGEIIKKVIVVFAVAAVALALYTKTFVLGGGILFTVFAVVVVAGVGWGKFHGHDVLKILGHMKTIVSCPFTYMIPSKHLMSTHIYTETSYLDSTLKYEGDLPVLSLKGTPREKGLAQGYILGDQIYNFLKIWGAILWMVIPDRSHAKELCDHLITSLSESNLEESRNLLEEMIGVVEGFNIKMVSSDRDLRLTVDELLMFHLIPDSEHTYPIDLAKSLIPPVGCSVVITNGQTAEEKLMLRLMDWPSFNIVKSSLLYRRYGENGKIIHDVGIPGLVGTTTAMSNTGLALAMNVALGETKNPMGIPAIFINRILIERCNTVEEAENQLKTLSPIGPYHLSLVSANGETRTIHFYQGEKEGNYSRTLGDKNHLIVTNSCIGPDGEYNPYFNSEGRTENINTYFASHSGTPEELLEGVSKLPLVNNQETVHALIINPRERIMKMTVANAYAADRPLITVAFPE